jgi:hypothetical protein
VELSIGKEIGGSVGFDAETARPEEANLRKIKVGAPEETRETGEEGQPGHFPDNADFQDAVVRF